MNYGNMKNEQHCWYHIYNEGIDGGDIFQEKDDFIFFLKRIREVNKPSPDTVAQRVARHRGVKPKKQAKEDILIKVIAYNLNPNHFHLLIKSENQKNISKFMQKLSTSYTKYFNHKYKRQGPLFIGRFKIENIKENMIYDWSIFINLNHTIHNPADIICSSIDEYVHNQKGLCDSESVSRIIKDKIYPSKPEELDSGIQLLSKFN